MRSRKILCLFDYNATTGFATVSQNIISLLKKHFGDNLSLDIVAINYFGESYTQKDGTRVYPGILPVNGEVDEFGRHRFLQFLANGNYDGIFIIQDIGIITPIIPMLREIKKRKSPKNGFKSIFYFPIDGVPLKKWFDDIDFFDVIITYTKYATNEILKIRPDLNGKLIDIIHGINLKDFYPMAPFARFEFRKFYFGSNAGKFIINAGNRNQPRKDFPTLMLGFKLFKSLCPDSLLYLHCNPRDHMGHDLYLIAEQLGLVEGEDFMFPPKDYFDAGAAINVLNSIINSCDVYLTTTSGEGFGFWPAQAAACKIPVIAPFNTSLIEMSGHGKHFLCLMISRPYINHFDSMVRTQCEPSEVAALLWRVKDKHDENQDRIQKAYKYIQSLSWETVIKEWIDVFDKTFFKK